MTHVSKFRSAATKTVFLFMFAAVLVAIALGNGTSLARETDATLPSRVVVAQTQDINSFDVARITGSVGINVLTHAAEPLVFEHHDQAKGIVPWLAESWKTIDDTTWVFELREGVKFHNGEPFTADAVVYSLERYRDTDVPNLAHAYYWDLGLMESVEARDDHTVVIKTSAPSPTLLSVLSQMYIVEPKWTAVQSHDTTNKEIVGTGPFQLVNWVKDDHVLMKAFPDYWFGRPLTEELVFRVVPEVGTRVAELLAGGVHIAPVTMDQVGKLNTAHTRGSVDAGSRIVYMGMVTDKPHLPTSNKLVRQAINYAVDVDTITQSLFRGHTKPYAGVLPAAYSDPAVRPYLYDPQKARELLREAGYPNGFDIVIDAYPDRLEVAQVVAMYLNQVGIRARVESHEWGNYVQQVTSKQTNPIYILGQGGFPSAFEQLSTIFDPRNAAAAAHGYADDEFYALLDEAMVTVDEEKHADLLLRAQRKLWDDAPVIFLYTDPVALGISQSIPNLEASARDSLRLYWALTEPYEQ